MTKNKKQMMQFLFADRELIIKVADLLSAPVDVIVNPANVGLVHGGGVARLIANAGGDIIQKESDLFIKEHGQLESGMVAFTSAGKLPYKAIIHAVGPQMGEGNEQHKIEQAVSRSLMLCNMHDWHSIAFPAISTGIFSVPVEIAARAFYRAISSFWDARIDGSLEKVIICLTEKSFQIFFDEFRNHARGLDDGSEVVATDSRSLLDNNEAERNIGVVELSEKEISELADDDIQDWFK